MKKQYQQDSAKRGFAFGKALALCVALGVLGGGAWIGKRFLDKEENKSRGEVYWTAKKADFLLTVKLTGTLVSTDVITIKSDLEGTTTIQMIVEEGTQVEGNTIYTIQAGDTLESISEATRKDELSIKLLNDDEKIDWENLPAGKSIQIPGDLLVELDPLSLRERINSQEIVLQQSENNLNRSRGQLETLKLSTTLALKIAENNHQIAQSDLAKAKNSTVKNYIADKVGLIANLEKDVLLAEKNLKAYTELKDLGFVSDVEVLREEVKRDKALHNIKMSKADLEAYKKYDQVSLISIKQLAVDETQVNIKKTKVQNKADLSDANSTVFTREKTLELEKDKLSDLNQQMASTKIYAPESGQVVYYPGNYREFGPIMEGAKVHRGRNLIKLPKDKSLKVELEVPQAKRWQLRKNMPAWVEVDDVTLRGTLSMIAATVDTNKRRHSETIVFNGEISIDSSKLPSTASEGMKVRVEIQVVNLVKEQQRIKIPNQCVTIRVRDGRAEQGCWVLNPITNKPAWRPVTIEYSDENFIAIKEETDPQRGLREDELVHLSPLSEAENLNLEEAVMGKGDLEPSTNKETESQPKEDGAARHQTGTPAKSGDGVATN
jgi:multidrug resistance efflux pump